MTPPLRCTEAILTVDKRECGTLEGGTVQEPRAHASLADPCDDAVGVWPVGRALPRQEWQKVCAATAGLFLFCQPGDGLMVQVKCLPDLRLRKNVMRCSFIVTVDTVGCLAPSLVHCTGQCAGAAPFRASGAGDVLLQWIQILQRSLEL